MTTAILLTGVAGRTTNITGWDVPNDDCKSAVYTPDGHVVGTETLKSVPQRQRRRGIERNAVERPGRVRPDELLPIGSPSLPDGDRLSAVAPEPGTGRVALDDVAIPTQLRALPDPVDHPVRVGHQPGIALP